MSIKHSHSRTVIRNNVDTERTLTQNLSLDEYVLLLHRSNLSLTHTDVFSVHSWGFFHVFVCVFAWAGGGGEVAYIFRKASASQGVFQRSDGAHIAGYRRDEEAKSACSVVWGKLLPQEYF